jgi:spermidine/putrescine transport system permease protein
MLVITERLALAARRYRLAPVILAGPATAFLLLLLVLPLASVVELSGYRRGEAGIVIPELSLVNYRALLAEPIYLRVLSNSVSVAAIVTLVTVAVAFVPAAVIGLTRSRFKGILFLLILVPFWTSFIVRTYAWIVLLGTNGVVNGALRASGVIDTPLSLLYSRSAVVLGLVHAMLPFAIVPIYASIERIDDYVLEAASTLGARPWAIFAEIVIPLSMPGVLAAALLVFIEALGAFLTPQLLGSAGDMMIAQLIQEKFLQSFDWPFGSAITVVYLAFTGLAFAALMVLRQIIARRLA